VLDVTTPAPRQEAPVSITSDETIFKDYMAPKKGHSHSTLPLITNGSKSSVYGHEPGAIKKRTTKTKKENRYEINRIPQTGISDIFLHSGGNPSGVDTNMYSLVSPHVTFETPSALLLQRPVMMCKSIDISLPSLNRNGKYDLSFMRKELPCWLMYGNDHYSKNLMSLSAPKLQTISNQCISQLTHPELQRKKTCYISNIVSHFNIQRQTFISNNSAELLSDVNSYSQLASQYFSKIYGEELTGYLRDPPFIQAKFIDEYQLLKISEDILWVSESLEVLVQRIQKKFSIENICDIINTIPFHRRPYINAQSHWKTIKFLILHIQLRISYLATLSPYQLCGFVIALTPNFNNFICQPVDLIEKIIHTEYGLELIYALNSSVQFQKEKTKEQYNNMLKRRRRENHRQVIEEKKKEQNKLEQEWPTVVPKDLILNCVNAYREGTIWVPPPVCAVCGQAQHVDHFNIDVAAIELERPPILKLLENKNDWIHIHCPSALSYEGSYLNNLLLDPLGITNNIGPSGQYSTIRVCQNCYGSLGKNKIPRFALVNNLFRGILPDAFKDLTWVEEMVCAIYRNTAHITRLYGSSDPKNPTVLHGNTCAHDMNIISTASVLPRTPADINGMLSIVFIGAGKLKIESLRHILRVRKSNIWSFLVYLKQHNRLYKNIGIDENLINLYPIDGILPGIDQKILYDHESNGDQIFAQESAGFSDHPATEFVNNSKMQDHESIDTEVMLEKMGVSDPESVKLSGRSFTASALRNLVTEDTQKDLPDLLIHSGNTAIAEYNNPDLFLGMFPTLFPLGIGGFDDKTRPTNLSFQQQAQYYFNISDRSFRYHYSYIFVAFNIWQRRLAHLHTHFTVRNSHFESVAQKLISVSSATLLQLADQLEKEKSLNNMTSEQKNAMELLNKVNTISTKMPGSQAMKMFIRNEIRSYFSYFALPHIYLTFNPCAAHSPLFQVMFGDSNVDLSERFPKMVGIRERALRLAKDPVAAADYFEFCIYALFKYLLGWDFDKRKSDEKGGILGKLRAFYGTSEFTDRGSLHGHFLIWLIGGLNPSDLHEKLCSSKDFEQKFFNFFESIIHHHLPDIEVQIDSSYEPRAQRPPVPPKSLDPTYLDIIKEWDSVYVTEVKMCGEVLQRHKCGSVCHKYGNDKKCRFLFPHEIIEASYFDQDTNSVVLLCRDSTVNYFNPYILIFCRHNHDIKCILSGKGAKAAMFYISDYITKMDMKTYQSLTLLSKAVARMTNSAAESAIEAAKTLLHKCISQFTRQQQIHAQQAVRYLQGHGDGISSHETVSMASVTLMAFIKNAEWNKTEESHNTQNEEIEPLPLRIQKNSKGDLINTHQLQHYLYRDDSLAQMSFFDFCQCIRLELRSKSERNKNTHETRLGVLRRHKIQKPHPLSDSHTLVEHWNEEYGIGHNELVPRVVGMSIPRETSKEWLCFALAHFKPFSVSQPLLSQDQTWEDAYQRHSFSDRHLCIMRNWNAVHECEDERDAERLKRQNTATAESKALTSAIMGTGINSEDLSDDIHLMTSTKQSRKDFHIQQFILSLQQANWLKSPKADLPTTTLPILNSNPSQNKEKTGLNLDLQNSVLKKWQEEIKTQETLIIAKRRNFSNSENQMMSCPIKATESCQNVCYNLNCYSQRTEIPETVSTFEISKPKNGMPVSHADASRLILDTVETKFQLNERQVFAFRIIASNFLDRCVSKKKDVDPVCMLMTGPGGTGKTYTVKAVKEVMGHYKCGHKIRFLAPTGGTASLIDGMTIHKGLGIKIVKKKESIGTSEENYSVTISIQNKTALREEWRDVEIVLIDEISLLSEELLCEVDHALRYAKECPDIWFGGIIVIFAGDLFQYPPVMGTSLYTPISTQGKTTDDEFKKRFGRLAWKTVDTVVDMVVQQRMKSDKEYGDAVLRLRTRECTLEDIDLFNSRVIKSANNPEGIDMGNHDNLKATAIVQTNALREVINISKAQANCTSLESSSSLPELVVCGSNDVVKGLIDLEPSDYKDLLHLDFTSSKIQRSLPGFVSLYIGMPVVLRTRNLSTELKITNGAQGIVRHFVTKILPHGIIHCTCAIVEFPESPILLSGLPRGYYPITLSTFSFTTKIKDIKVQVTRHQLPLQPAFAVTGHFAQGKSMPKILAALHEGGYAAYVAASRAFNREGLCITQPVRQQDLNTPLPYNLFIEHKRLKALEHNTYIKYGILDGESVKVPDQESNMNIDTSKMKITPTFLHLGKRTREPSDILNLDPDLPLSKHSRIKKNSETPFSNPKKQYQFDSLNPFFSAGCQWSPQNWSCAYDSIFMSLFSLYLSLDHKERNLLRNQLNQSDSLGESLNNLLDISLRTAQNFNQSRDKLRDYLSSKDPYNFIRYGHHGTSASAVLEKILPIRQELQIYGICSNNCASTNLPYKTYMRTLISQHEQDQINIANFVKYEFQNKTTEFSERGHTCSYCLQNTISNYKTLMITAPNVLYFETENDSNHIITPSLQIRIPCRQGSSDYRLSSIIYFGDFHFTTRLLPNNGTVWKYDGRVKEGKPQLEQVSLLSEESLQKMENRSAHICIYRLVRIVKDWPESLGNEN